MSKYGIKHRRITPRWSHCNVFLSGTFYAAINKNDQNKISQRQEHTVLNTNICLFLTELATMYDKTPATEKRKITHPILIAPTRNTTEKNTPQKE